MTLLGNFFSLKHSVVDGVYQCLADARHVEFFEKTFFVVFYRVGRLVNLIANLPHGVALRREPKHFLLYVGEYDAFPVFPIFVLA